MVTVLQIVAHAAAGPDGSRGVNGPELRALHSLADFDPDRVRLIIAYSGRGRLWSRFAAAGVELVDFTVGGKGDWRAAGGITRLLRRYKADVLHTQGPGSLDLHGLCGARLAGVPLMVTRPVMIRDLLVSGWRRRAYGWWDGFVRRGADLIVAVSEDGRQRLIEEDGVPPTRVRLVYNGVDLRRFRPGLPREKARFGLTGSGPVLGMSAQLTKVKGWPDFLAIAAEARRRVPTLQALIIGDGPLHEEVRSAAAALDLAEAVRFTGHLDDVAPALACLDVCVSTSRREGLSVAVIEAMATGLPCVITAVGGARELVAEGENGHVVRPGDVTTATARVVELLTDPGRRAAMGVAARARCERFFDQRRMAAQYQELYEQLAFAAKMGGRGT